MKNQILILFCLCVLIQSCKDNPTDNTRNEPLKLVLTSDKTNGSAPLEVNFTGTLNGKIDTIRMHFPPMVFYPGLGRTIIRYALPDTSVSAQRTYTSSHTYTIAGTFKAVMLLQGLNQDIYSDTLIITVN
jgi:PKD repeat protein